MKTLLFLVLLVSYAWIHIGAIALADEKSFRCSQLLNSFINESGIAENVSEASQKGKKEKGAKHSESAKGQGPSRANLQKIQYVESKIPQGITKRDEVNSWVRTLLTLDAQTIHKSDGKKQIFLGHQLADGSTLQFEYSLADLPLVNLGTEVGQAALPRFSQKYYLVGIRFIPRNLARFEDKSEERAYELIVKYPLKPGTFDLKEDLSTDFWVAPETGGYQTLTSRDQNKAKEGHLKENLSEESLNNEPRPEMPLSVIPVLEGPALERFLIYKEATRLLDRVTVVDDLSQKSAGLMRLKVHGFNSRFIRAFKDRIGKKLLGLIIVVAAITAYYKFPGYYQEFVKPSFDRAIPSQVVTGADYTHFAYISEHVTNRWSVAPSFVEARKNLLYSAAVPSPKVVEDGMKHLAQLISHENELEKGKVSLVAFDEGLQYLQTISGDRSREVFKQRLDSSRKEDSFFLVGMFKKTGKIYMAKLHYQEHQDKPFWISYLTFDKKQEPELYVGLTQLIQTQARASKESDASEMTAGGSNQNLNPDSSGTSLNLMDLISGLNPLARLRSLKSLDADGEPASEQSD